MVDQADWIAQKAALDLFEEAGKTRDDMLKALRLGRIKAQGIDAWKSSGLNSAMPPGSASPELINPSLWATWTFNERLNWLVPAGSEKRRVCSGFEAVEISRADVEAACARNEAQSEGERKPAMNSEQVKAAVDIMRTAHKERADRGEPWNRDIAREVLASHFPDTRIHEKQLRAIIEGADAKGARGRRASKTQP